MKASVYTKYTVVIFGIVAVLSIGLLLPSTSTAKAIKLSYANFPPAPTFPCVQMERWVDEVEQRTGGQVKVDTYPGGTLLGAKNMMDGVIAGQADIGCLCMAYQPGRFIVTNATALPVWFSNAKIASLTLWDLYNKYQPEAFADVKVLTMFTCAPANIYAQKAVHNLDDLKGLELRASGGAAQVLEYLGATPVGMPQSECPEALRKGVVKGAFSSLETLMDFKYAELCQYVTIMNGPVYPFAVVMNKKSWDALPADVKKVMDDLGREQALWTGTYMDDHVNESIAWSKKTHNIEVYNLPAREHKKWQEKVEPIIDKWIEDASAKDLPAKKILKDIEKWQKKYSKEYSD
jgi:TRAP-type C4-dicarboxylate transport system substrate-binding protein